MEFDLRAIKDPLRREYLAQVFKVIWEAFKQELISIVIYGSVARSQDKPSSDTDVLLLLDTKDSFYDRAEKISKCLNKVRLSPLGNLLEANEYNTFVEFYPLSVSEASMFRPIYLDMVEDALVIYDKNSFFEKLLLKIKRLLNSLHSTRVKLPEGGWYWLLKPDLKFGEELRLDLEE